MKIWLVHYYIYYVPSTQHKNPLCLCQEDNSRGVALNEIEAFVWLKIQGQGVSSVEGASKQEWQAPYGTSQNIST